MSDGQRSVRTFCRICQAQCGVVLDIDGQQILRVSGDRDHPISQGYTCSKGRSIGAAHHHPDRLEQPMLRGTTAPWDIVLDDLARSLGDIIERHGPNAVACYRSTAWVLDTSARSVIDRWTRAIGTRQLYSPATIDTPNRMLVPDLMLGAPFIQPVVDWDHAETLLLFGHNLVVSHGHATVVPDPVRRIRAVRDRGGSVVVVDPRRTETALLADVHLQVRPGTDAAVLAHLVRHRLMHGRDADYIAAFLEPASVARLEASVAPFAAARVAEICDVDVEQIELVAGIVASSARLATVTGTGISMGPTPNAAEWLAWALTLVTGSLDRPGGLLVNPGVIRPQSERGPTTLARETGPPPASRPDLAHAYGEYPSAVLCDEILAGNVRALLSFGGNIVASFPDSSKTVAAMRSLEVFAIAEVRPTQTTEVATHVLPTCGQLERHDVTYFIDQAFPVPFAQYTAPVVEPVGDRRELWRVMAELAQRMGLVIPAIAAITDTEELIRGVLKWSRVSLDDLKAAPSGLLVDADAPGWLVPAKLPRGVIDVAPAPLVEQFERWADQVVPMTGTLRLICRRVPHQMNSDLQEVARQQRAPFPHLLMNPSDAMRLGLQDGMAVTVSTAHGSTGATLELVDTLRVGVVSLPHSWRFPDVNRLTTTDEVDPLTGMPRFSDFAVSVTAT